MMSEYFSELLNTQECRMHRKAKEAIRRNRYKRIKVDPVVLENVLISLDYCRQTIAKLERQVELARKKEGDHV